MEEKAGSAAQPCVERSLSTMEFQVLSSYLDSLGERYGVPGLDFKIMKEHQTVYRHMAGCSDYLGRRPVEGSELYDLYSCTKVVTMTGVMQLVEQGKLGLEDKLSDYLPEFAQVRVADQFDLAAGGWPRQDAPSHPAQTPITIRHLMTMTAGLSYNTEGEPLQEMIRRNPMATTRELVGEIAKMPLLFEPGTHWSYALCHDVLGAVIEVVSGESFSDYLTRHIFQPLGMEDAYFHLPPQARFRRFAQYTDDPQTGKKLPAGMGNHYRLTPLFESGGAGLTASLDSYILLLDALSCGGVGATGKRILTPASVEAMGKNQLQGEPLQDFIRFGRIGYSYGLGVRVMVDNSAARTPLGEFGWDGAAGAFGLIDPIHHVSLFYTQQILNMGPVYYEIHPRLRDLAFEELARVGLV